MPRPDRTPAPGDRALRADARRNVAAILDAGERCLSRSPDASIAEIAREAGVGRVTLYAHFASRAELVDAVFARVVNRTEKALDAVDTTGDPLEALRRLVASSWRVVHRFRSILAAAERELPPERIRAHHERHLERLSGLLGQGRRRGVVRDDLPVDWLVTVCMTVMHAAAEEVQRGRLEEDEAGHAVAETVLGVCLPRQRPDVPGG